MKYFFFLLVLGFVSHANAGTWSLIDPSTVYFEGDIDSDEYDRFRSVFHDEVKTLILNSGGGDTSAALRIAMELVTHDLNVVATNLCLSSCANYLFLAGKSKKIEKGIVGYHGNVTACFGDKRWSAFEADLRARGFDEVSIEAVRENLWSQMELEKKFFESIGVSQELFDRSCELDKGLGDGKTYSFLLPSPATFSKYGIHSVEGFQDYEIMKTYPGTVLD